MLWALQKCSELCRNALSFAEMLWALQNCSELCRNALLPFLLTSLAAFTPLWQFWWANQKWLHSFSACRALMQSSPLSWCSGHSGITHLCHCFPVQFFDNAIGMLPSCFLYIHIIFYSCLSLSSFYQHIWIQHHVCTIQLMRFYWWGENLVKLGGW